MAQNGGVVECRWPLRLLKSGAGYADCELWSLSDADIQAYMSELLAS